MRTLTLLALLLCLLVIGLGAYTRLTDAGLGCPDWPGCYGHWTVPAAEQAVARFPDQPLEHHKAWNEMIHRYLAGALGLLIALLAVVGWRRGGTLRWLTAALLLLVCAQALLGMLTVTLMLMPLVVVAHLLGGFATLCLLLLLYWQLCAAAGQPLLAPPPQVVGGLRLLAAVGVAVVVMQILLGGWTSANYAALVCHQLPLCEPGWQQQFTPSAFNPYQPGHASYQYGVLDHPQRITIHVSHRLGAMVVALMLALLIIRLWRWQRALALLLATALVLQLALGLANVLLVLPLAVAVGHNLGAALLLAMLLLINLWLWSSTTSAVGVRGRYEQSPDIEPLAAQPRSAVHG